MRSVVRFARQTSDQPDLPIAGLDPLPEPQRPPLKLNQIEVRRRRLSRGIASVLPTLPADANVCPMCFRDPEFFDVPDDVWDYYLVGKARQAVICPPCWAHLINRIDDGQYAREHGQAVPLWSPEFRRRHGIGQDVPTPERVIDWYGYDPAKRA
jgi:hypothetical protein